MQSFKLILLKDYYESGKLKSFICYNYDIEMSNFLRWKRQQDTSFGTVRCIV